MRTIALIVGLPPMTQFDAAATPMLASFTDTPNLQPYSAVVPDQPLDEMNTAASPMSAQSETMDFTAEDRAPEQALNETIWQSVRGDDSSMPVARTSFRGAIHASPAPATADDD